MRRHEARHLSWHYVIYEPLLYERARGWRTPLFDFDMCTRTTIDAININHAGWYPLAVIFVPEEHSADFDVEIDNLEELLPKGEAPVLGVLRIENRGTWTPIDVLDAAVSNDAAHIVWMDRWRERWWD